MKKNLFVVIALFLIYRCAYAHDVDRAFFNILEKENTTEVIAELPWSIRNSVIKDNPNLENTKSQELLDTAFFNYVKRNLVLYEKDGNTLDLKSVSLIPDEGHSHAGKYLLVYKGKGIMKVKNTFLFNLYKTQVNYHELKKGELYYKFTTEKDSSEKMISTNDLKKNYYLWLIGLGILLTLLILAKKTVANKVHKQ